MPVCSQISVPTRVLGSIWVPYELRRLCLKHKTLICEDVLKLLDQAPVVAYPKSNNIKVPFQPHLKHKLELTLSLE